MVVGKEDAPAGQRGRGSLAWPWPWGPPWLGGFLQGFSCFCLKGSGTSTVGTVPSSSVTGEPMETSPVIHLVTDAKGTVIHEVHVQMQELPLGMKTLAPEVRAGRGEWPLSAQCQALVWSLAPAGAGLTWSAFLVLSLVAGEVECQWHATGRRGTGSWGEGGE